MPANEIHPDIMKAIRAVELPDVQEMMRRLAKYGLGIAVPHMHGDDGQFLPLPVNRVALEDDLQVSFRNAEDAELQDFIPVMWRSEPGEVAARCVQRCRYTTLEGHLLRHTKT